MAKIDIFPTPIYKFKVIQNTIDEAIVKSKHLDSLKEYKKWNCHVETSFGDSRDLNTENYYLTNTLEECLFPFLYDFISQMEKKETVGLSISECWINKYQKNSFQERHSHVGQGSGVSFIYMYKTTKEHSALRLYNPSEMILENALLYTPINFSYIHADLFLEEREVLFFPSYLNHSVYPVKDEGERITLSGNIRVT